MDETKGKVTNQDVLRWLNLEGKFDPADFDQALHQMRTAGDAFKAMGSALAQLSVQLNTLLADINEALGPEAVKRLQEETAADEIRLPWTWCCKCKTTHLGVYCAHCGHTAEPGTGCCCLHVPPPFDLAEGAIIEIGSEKVSVIGQNLQCYQCGLWQIVKKQGCDKCSGHIWQLPREGGAHAIPNK
ncbi:MAG: hypothetical protein WC322_04900 [Candidatus Paceibacterota bacterium]